METDKTYRTGLGRIKGIVREDAISFLGIPYAKPPVGELRWKPPAAPDRWSGVYDATEYPNRAFQPPLPERLDVGEIPGEMSEDCLYLNIHRPVKRKRKRPVLVWIHGGGFVQGSANDFDPIKFALDYDVLVVAMNYRLGMLGFLDLSRFGPEYDGSAAIGFQDQILALKWIKDNISDYGGDDDNITICGGSAGGGSVLAMIAAPKAKGLFDKAIAISPSEIPLESPDVITPYAAALKMEEEAFFEYLKSLSGEEVFKLQNDGGVGGLAAIDGTILPKTAAEAIKAGINPVPLIAGCTINEGPMLTELLGDDPNVLKFFETALASQAGVGAPEQYLAFLDTVVPENATPAERVDRVWFDVFRSAALRPAQALSEVGVDAWIYSWEAPTDHPFGPTHGSDVRFVFNGFDESDDGEMQAFYKNTAANREIAAMWSQTMVNFIRNGDPNWSGIPNWPTYNAQTRASLVVREAPSIIEDYDAEDALAAYRLI